MVGEPPLRDSTIRTTIGKESGFGGGSRIHISGLSSVRNEMRRTVQSPWRELRWGGGSWAVTPHALVSKRPRDDARRRRRRGRRRRRARRRRRGALRPSGHDTKRALVLQLGATPARKRHRSQHRRAGEGGRGRIVTSVPFPASGVNHEPMCKKARGTRGWSRSISWFINRGLVSGVVPRSTARRVILRSEIPA